MGINLQDVLLLKCPDYNEFYSQAYTHPILRYLSFEKKKELCRVVFVFLNISDKLLIHSWHHAEAVLQK